MTSTPQPQPAPARRLPVREVVGLVLVLCSTVGLVWVAFAATPLLGAAALAVLAGVAGAWLCSSDGGA